MVQVTLAGGEGRPAKVVGFDEDKDVAVLLIDTSAAAAAAAAAPAVNGSPASIPTAAASASLSKDPKMSGSMVRAGGWDAGGCTAVLHNCFIGSPQSIHPYA